MRTPCILKKRATPNGATPRHFTALRFKVALQRCLYPSCGTIIVSLDGLRRQLAQFAPDRRLNMLRTGGSSHTGQAAPPHRNIHQVSDCFKAFVFATSANSEKTGQPFRSSGTLIPLETGQDYGTAS